LKRGGVAPAKSDVLWRATLAPPDCRRDQSGSGTWCTSPCSVGFERAHPHQAVHHVARAESIPAEAAPSLGAARHARGVERARLLVHDGAVLIDPERLWIREHGTRMGVELGEHPRKPSRVPSIVVARPREVLGARMLAPGHLDDFPPRRHHALPLLVPDVTDAAILPLVSPRHLLDLVARPVVEHQEGEVAMRLREDGIGRFAQVLRVVVQRHAEHGAR